MNAPTPALEPIIHTIEHIPTLPVISRQILDIREDDPNSHRKYVNIIEQDQSLTLKVLKVANSAFYGSLSRVGSVDHALVRLGTNEVKSIVLAFSVQTFFSEAKSNAYDRKRFWKHAIVCSQVAKLLGIYHRIRSDDSLFLAGLIHDMGKVVLDEYFHEDFLRILDILKEENATFSQAEKVVLGTTHYQVGAKLLKQWRFPRRVITQVLFHHAPWYDKENENHTILLYLANVLTKITGYTCHPDEQPLDIGAFAASPEAEYVSKSGFDIDLKTLQNLVSRIQEHLQEEAENVLTLFD
jgi:putative nucleotidyltransferase with HDIG domain